MIGGSGELSLFINLPCAHHSATTTLCSSISSNVIETFAVVCSLQLNLHRSEERGRGREREMCLLSLALPRQSLLDCTPIIISFLLLLSVPLDRVNNVCVYHRQTQCSTVFNLKQPTGKFKFIFLIFSFPLFQMLAVKAARRWKEDQLTWRRQQSACARNSGTRDWGEDETWTVSLFPFFCFSPFAREPNSTRYLPDFLRSCMVIIRSWTWLSSNCVLGVARSFSLFFSLLISTA